MICPKCGQTNEDRAAYCQMCGGSLLLETSSPAAAAEPYAGFWKRFAAIIIDAIIVSAATGFLIAITFGGGTLFILVGHWLYEAWLTSSEWQATVGKRVLRIVVTDIHGRRITFARASGRHFAKYISAFLLFAGYIIAAFSAKKQALHDMIADTLVVNRV